MQSWIPEIWQAAVIGLVVGVILGYGLLRLTKGSVKKQVQTEAELKEVKTQKNILLKVLNYLKP